MWKSTLREIFCLCYLNYNANWWRMCPPWRFDSERKESIRGGNSVPSKLGGRGTGRALPSLNWQETFFAGKTLPSSLAFRENIEKTFKLIVSNEIEGLIHIYLLICIQTFLLIVKTPVDSRSGMLLYDTLSYSIPATFSGHAQRVHKKASIP